VPLRNAAAEPMNLGGIERCSQGIFQSRASAKGAFRVAARRQFWQRFFLVLGVAAAQQSAGSPSIAAAAMTGRTAWSCTLTSLPSSKKSSVARSWCHSAAGASAQCGLTTSLKGSANGVPPGPGRRYPVHFRPPGPGVTPSAPPLARTLGLGFYPLPPSAHLLSLSGGQVDTKLVASD
jgi:hypothetical protein